MILDMKTGNRPSPLKAEGGPWRRPLPMGGARPGVGGAEFTNRFSNLLPTRKTFQNMKLADFHYDLPATRIAQEPIEPRDHSRLLVLDRKSQNLRAIKHFYTSRRLLKAGDVLFSMPHAFLRARLRGKKATGGKN
jgi:hypothetical protein